MGKKILVSDDGFSELLEGLCGIKAVIPKNSFGNIFTLPSDFKKTRLNEAYYATYPIEKAVGYLKKRYGKTAYVDWLEGENGEEVIEVAMDDSEYNQNIVDSDLSLCGYYPSYVEKIGKQRNVTYEKRFQDSVSDIVKEKGTIYHLTRRDRLHKIMANGLCPRTEDKMFKYPDRIYFFLEAPSIEECKFCIEQFSRYTKDHSKDYVLLENDVEDLNIEFYYDPNMENAVYTKDNISPSRIEIFYEKI